MNEPEQHVPRVDPVDRPEPLPFRIPVPDTGGAFPFGHRLTLQAIGRANMAQGAVEEYARAQIDATYTAPPWRQSVPATIGEFIELSFEDARYRSRGSMATTALLVPTWVVDHLADTDQPARVPIIEIPMNPTAPVWHAVAIASHQRPPSLVHPRWQALARYPCPALPEHLEAFEARQAAEQAAREHERKFAGLGAQLIDAGLARRIAAEMGGDPDIITDDPEVQQRQIRARLFDSTDPEGGRDDR
jgi:hypothetical protein